MVSSAGDWAAQQWGAVDLGDKRLNRRAVIIGARMAAQPGASLPQQMQGRAQLDAAYAFLNDLDVTVEALTAPHRGETLRLAGERSTVLMIEDTTELDYSQHRAKTGMGPIGDGRGRGLLLHSTLAVVPEVRLILGLAHIETVLRVPHDKAKKWARSPEGLVWEVSAKQVGRPPKGVIWVHVSDSGSDIFEYMLMCRELDKHFVVRTYHNRELVWQDGDPAADAERVQRSLDYARSLPPVRNSAYTVTVPAQDKQPARQAVLALAWAKVTVVAPSQAPKALRQRGPLTTWILRAWEPDAPAGVKAVEWVLLASVPINTLADAQRTVHWYTCRWLCEDYHQCLKTGCGVEKSQLDDGADITRLLGFVAPLATRLLQLRQEVRQAPAVPAITVVEPLMVKVLAHQYQLDWQTLPLDQFYRYVAMLGGYLGRRRDGPPGWRTLWRGWRYLSDRTAGARLFATGAIT